MLQYVISNIKIHVKMLLFPKGGHEKYLNWNNILMEDK